MAKKKIGKMKIVYNHNMDEFQLWSKLNGEEEWGFVCGCRCVFKKDDEAEMPEYIRWSILGELRKFAELGYELIDEGNEV